MNTKSNKWLFTTLTILIVFLVIVSIISPVKSDDFYIIGAYQEETNKFNTISFYRDGTFTYYEYNGNYIKHSGNYKYDPIKNVYYLNGGIFDKAIVLRKEENKKKKIYINGQSYKISYFKISDSGVEFK